MVNKYLCKLLNCPHNTKSGEDSGDCGLPDPVKRLFNVPNEKVPIEESGIGYVLECSMFKDNLKTREW